MKLDQDAIDKLKNGDDTTFEKLYHGTKRGVYGIVFSILRDHDKTADVLQDVYMKVLIKINQYKVGTNFNSWIMQIAKNYAIDIYRQEKKHTHIEDEVLEQVVSEDRDLPDEKSKILMMLDNLTEDERIVIILKVLDDLTHKEISKIIDKPIGTVLWLYQKGLDKLKDYYGEYDA